MTFTLTEAEKILTKVFSDIAPGGNVRIDVVNTVTSPTGEIVPGFTVSAPTFDKILRLLAHKNEKIEAIKLYREVQSNKGTGVGLAEAKAYIEQLAAAP